MSTTFDVKTALKLTKLNPAQKMTLSKRFQGREFPAVSEQDNVYQVTFGEVTVHIRAVEGGLKPDEMDLIADVLQRTRKKEQKAMMDMLTIIQVFPLAQDTMDVLIEEWKENGVEATLVKGPGASEPQATEEVSS
ncbi:MAG TPA: hypothetical protein VFV52_16690 [Bacilli bacterium]|nr:hypothetical protein [Bacilli bacterium]